MNCPGGLQRNPFRVLITPPALSVADVYFPLSLMPAVFWDLASATGGDIRVRAQDGYTPLPCHLVGFDSVARVGSLFIKVGSATAFYVYFGNRQWVQPSASSTYGQYNAYEAANVLAMHLEDAGDSTVNQNNGTATGVTFAAAGKILKGATIASSNLIDVPYSASFNLTAAFTVSAWMKASTLITNGIMEKTVGGAPNKAFSMWGAPNTPVFKLRVQKATVNTDVTSTDTYNATTFTQVVGRYNGSEVSLWVNGVKQASPATVTAPLDGGVGDLVLGQIGGGFFPMSGMLDEFYLHSRALSDAEILQRYNCQNNPAAFWTVGSAPEQV